MKGVLFVSVLAMGSMQQGGCPAIVTGSKFQVTDEIRRACPGYTDEEILESMDNFQLERVTLGTTQSQAIEAINLYCQSGDPSFTNSCIDCQTAQVEEVFRQAP